MNIYWNSRSKLINTINKITEKISLERIAD